MNNKPRDEKVNPPTCKAADGKTTLRRFRVDAVVYALNKKDALGRLGPDSGLGMYLDAATLIED